MADSNPRTAASDTPEDVTVERDELVARLDGLLERYLCTLDEYAQLGVQMGELMATGYLELARANFQNRDKAVRFGRDCYDERMRAVRTVIIEETEGKMDFTTTCCLPKSASEGGDSTSEEKEEDTSGPEKESPDPTTSDETHHDDDPPQGGVPQNDEDPSENLPKNPIRMFGILVPPSLRAAQSSFASAISGPIPALTSTSRSLREQEKEIGRVRKQLRKLSAQ